MSHLQKQQTQSLKRELERARRRTLDHAHQEIAQMAAHPFSELAGEGPDEADQAVAAELTDFGNAIVQHDVDQVRAIDAALRRIRERTFGSCVDCHGAIPLERLVASPTAIRCIECQTRYEHTHYQRVSYTL